MGRRFRGQDFFTLPGSKGHSFVEYAIVATLLVLVAIPALMSLGGGVNSQLSNSSQELSNADDLFSLLSEKKGSGGSGGASITSNGTTPTGEASGSSLPTYGDYTTLGMITTSVSGQQDLAKLAAESGISAIASQKLKDFNASILNLEVNGKLTPNQAALMRQLADQGLKIARIEAALEQVSDPWSPIVFEGKSYKNIRHLADRIGWGNVTPTTFSQTTDPLDPSSKYINPETKQFLKIYQKLDSSLTDPALKQWTADTAKEISVLTEAVEHAAYTIDPSTDVKQLSASGITEFDANLFCAAGNGNGNGKGGCNAS